LLWIARFHRCSVTTWLRITRVHWRLRIAWHCSITNRLRVSCRFSILGWWRRSIRLGRIMWWSILLLRVGWNWFRMHMSIMHMTISRWLLQVWRQGFHLLRTFWQLAIRGWGW